MHVHLWYTPFTLVLGYLANDPNFNQIAEELANINLGDSVERRINYQTEFPKLLKYLREEVKPLI